MNNTSNIHDEKLMDKEAVVDILDVEEYGKANKKPPKARRYRIRIDKKQYVVEQQIMTGRELLILSGNQPVEQFSIKQKLHGGAAKIINLDDSVDFSTKGVERFMTLPLDQTEG